MYESKFLHWMDKLYSLFIKAGSNLQSLFILYMRLTWGHQFFMTGISKLGDIHRVSDYFATLHIHEPLFVAYAVAFFETVCGLLLFIGLASRVAALPLIVIMLAALSTAHAPELSDLHFLIEPTLLVKQTPYPFLITALIVFVFGPGRISIDAWIKRWLDRQAKY